MDYNPPHTHTYSHMYTETGVTFEYSHAILKCCHKQKEHFHHDYVRRYSTCEFIMCM